MHILTTGASGFVGSWTSQRLKNQGFELVGFDCQPPSHQHYDAWHVGDVTDIDALTQAMAACEVVLHLAVLPQFLSIEDPVSDLRVNTLGTLQMLRAAEKVGVGKVILVSSSAVYGTNQGCLHENTSLRPTTPYGVSKMAAEAYCDLFHQRGHLHTTVLRLFNIYGLFADGSMRETVEGRFIKAVLAGNAPTIVGNPDRSFDFIHIEDVTQVISSLLTCQLPSGLTLNVGTGTATSLMQLATWCMVAAGIAGEPHVLPTSSTDAHSQIADLSRIEHYLDYRPQHDLRTWIQRMIKRRTG